MADTLLILGASARAAAFSACRAQLGVIAADLFADVDLAKSARTLTIENYPTDLVTAARRAVELEKLAGWIYTGGIENQPNIVSQIQQVCPLWGNGPQALARCRSPLNVRRVLREAGINAPEVALERPEQDRRLPWLAKPLRSAGGKAIAALTKDWHAADPTAWYFQQRIAGQSCAASYVMAGGRAMLLGLTRQLVGEAWTGASGFRYCGTLGPTQLTSAGRQQLEHIGAALASGCELQGLVGVDLVYDGAQYWPIEINPRYTASMEVLELAGCWSALDLHRAACCKGRLPDRPLGSDSTSPPFDPAPGSADRASPPAQVGKAVLFAPSDLIAPAVPCPADPWQCTEYPRLADLPQPGSRIEAGWPVLTVLDRADTEAELESRLMQQASAWQARWQSTSG